MSSPKSILRTLLILAVAIGMALAGPRALEVYTGDKSLAHPVWIAAISCFMWLVAFRLVINRGLLRAIIFGGISPFVGALLYMPVPQSLAYMFLWSPVAVPIGIFTGLLVWSIHQKLPPNQQGGSPQT